MRARLFALVCWAFAVVVPWTGTGQPAPQNASPQTAVIRGRVTSADSGRPLRRARVALLPATDTSARELPRAATDSRGQFALEDVPPGSYYVVAARAGYLTLQYGQRRPGERGITVDVDEGQTVDRIDVAMLRGGVLGGRITDERGEPYPGVRVDALDLRYHLGRRVPYPAGTATTDDLGQYRIAGLPPGTYYLAAFSSETWQTAKQELLGYATTYFPGVVGDEALRVELALSQARADLDFTLVASRPATVRGRVHRSTGAPLAAGSVTLARTFRGAGVILPGGIFTQKTQGDGTFEFRNVPPADYALSASVPSGAGGPEYADMDLAVYDDVEGVVLTTGAPSTVSGSVATDEDAPPPFPVSGVRIYLVAPDGRVMPTVRLQPIDDDWSFRLKDLGGPFLFRLRGLPDGWMLHEVRLDDEDITDVAYDVPTGGRDIKGLQVVVTRKIGTITGVVTDSEDHPTRDATVVLFSPEPALWLPGSRFVRVTRPTGNGSFSMTNLPPGDYLAVALEFVLDDQWEDREFLESLRKDAALVVLAEGGTEAVTLKVVGVR